jgi:hypothetical protein
VEDLMRRAWLACVALVALPGAAFALGADDLVGAWHVLVHYQDAGTENPEAQRWEDRIWVFEKAGDQLRWTDYPIVVFDDDAGRFEASAGNRTSRVLDYWEPNAAQQEQIRAGLAINSRGSRSKTLRGSDAKGWSSARRGGGYKSARVITYEETWNLDGLPDKPRFERLDSMGAAGGDDFEGRTLYETTEIAPGGDVLRGRYDRDGKRKGTFRLTRSGAVHSVGDEAGKTADGKKQSRSEFIAMLAPGLEALPGERSEADWRTAVTGPRAKQERLALRAAIEQGLRTQVVGGEEAIRSHYALLTNLAVELERLFAEDGKSLAELRKMMKNGEIDPGGAD